MKLTDVLELEEDDEMTIRPRNVSVSDATSTGSDRPPRKISVVDTPSSVREPPAKTRKVSFMDDETAYLSHVDTHGSNTNLNLPLKQVQQVCYRVVEQRRT